MQIVKITKTSAFAPKSCQNISSSIGFTKTRAFPQKSCHNNISRASPENKILPKLKKNA